MKTNEILKSKENALQSMFNKAKFTLYRMAFAPVRVTDKASVHIKIVIYFG